MKIWIWLSLCGLSFSGAQAAPHLNELAQRSDRAALLKNVQTLKQANTINAAGTPLIVDAASGGDALILKHLIDKGADLKAADARGHTALFESVSNGFEQNSLLLIKAGAPLENLYGEKKENLLFEVVRLGQIKVLQAVHKKNPKLIQSLNSENENLLFEAARGAQSEILKKLLKMGVSRDQKNNKGQRPIDLVNAKIDGKIFKLLKN